MLEETGTEVLCSQDEKGGEVKAFNWLELQKKKNPGKTQYLEPGTVHLKALLT